MPMLASLSDSFSYFFQCTPSPSAYHSKYCIIVKFPSWNQSAWVRRGLGKGTYQACHGDLRSRDEPSWQTRVLCVGLAGFGRKRVDEKKRVRIYILTRNARVGGRWEVNFKKGRGTTTEKRVTYWSRLGPKTKPTDCRYRVSGTDSWRSIRDHQQSATYIMTLHPSMMIAISSFMFRLRLLTFRPRVVDLTYNSLKVHSSKHLPSFTPLLMSE